MNCLNARELLNAYVDAELPPGLTEEVRRHLDACPACTLEVAELQRLAKHLDAIPEINTPAALARRTLKAFRANVEKPSIADWWQNMSFYMRGAACSVALAGLLFGLILGGSLSFLPDASVNSHLIAFYDTEVILP